MYRRIVVGVAKTESAQRAVDVAADLAQRYEADLHLVMAYDRSRGRDDAEHHLSLVGSQLSGTVHTHAVAGDPADTVLMVARDIAADLVVVGNQGMKGARRVLGSVPNSVAHGASCSVLIADTTS